MIIGIVLFIARGMKREALQDSVARQEQNENITEAVLDFVEGIGIIKTYNLLGEKSRELTDNFQRSCDTNLQFEEDHSPWQLRLNLAYGLGGGGHRPGAGERRTYERPLSGGHHALCL